MTRASSRFSIVPNPPMAGSPATIKYSGDGGTVTVSIPGQGTRDYKIPPNEIPINPVPDAPFIGVDDGSDSPEGATYWSIDQPREG